MLLWTFWWIVVSLLLIMLVHYLYVYMKNTLTIPIVEDTASKNKQRYDDMLAPVTHGNTANNDIEYSNNARNHDNTSNVNRTDDNSMKDELQTFLNELKTTGDAQGIGAQGIGAQGIGAQGIATNII